MRNWDLTDRDFFEAAMGCWEYNINTLRPILKNNALINYHESRVGPSVASLALAYKIVFADTFKQAVFRFAPAGNLDNRCLLRHVDLAESASEYLLREYSPRSLSLDLPGNLRSGQSIGFLRRSGRARHLLSIVDAYVPGPVVAPEEMALQN